MNRKQMIAWLTLEGVYVADFKDFGYLYEAYVNGACATAYVNNPASWSYHKDGSFEGGNIVPWESMSGAHVRGLYSCVKDVLYDP